MSLPDAPMQDAYQTGLYHLRTVCTKWSFPVGLMGHGAAWSGRFFGFDEMFAQSGAVSAGKFDISVRTPNFRKDLLPVAMRRVQHYSDNSIKNSEPAMRGSRSKTARKVRQIPRDSGLTTSSTWQISPTAAGNTTFTRAIKNSSKKRPIR